MDYEQLGLTLPESTLSWADRRASVRPLLESVLELLTRATAGPNIYGSFAKLSPDGSWLKIALGCSQLTMDGSSEIFSGVWPRRATMFAGIVGEQPTSERRISGTGFSFSENWPTPTTPNGGRSVAHVEDWRSDKTAYHNGRKVQVDLNAAVKMWPTPTATEATHGGPNQRDSSGRPGLTACVKQNWPTPTTRDYKSPDLNPDSKRFQQGTELNTAVAMWPTPNASDRRDRGNLSQPSVQRRMEIGKQLGLSMVASETSGALSPDWVETLQGYPAGWTKLPDGWKNKGGRQEKAQRNTRGSRQE